MGNLFSFRGELTHLTLNSVFTICNLFDSYALDAFSAEIWINEEEFEIQTKTKFIEKIKSLKIHDVKRIFIRDLNSLQKEGHVDLPIFESQIIINNSGTVPTVLITGIDYINRDCFKIDHLYHAEIHLKNLEILERNLDSDWERRSKNIPSFFPNPPEEIFYDGEKKHRFFEGLALHVHTILNSPNLMVSVAPIIFISSYYFKYFPKPLWLGLKDCESIVEIKHGIIVTILSDVNQIIIKPHYDKLWSVRRQLGIDTICHEICEPVKHLNYMDPTLPVVITLKNVQKGFTRVTRYLDKNGNLAEPQKAQTMEIKEYLEDGETCVLEEVKKKGIFGWR